MDDKRPIEDIAEHLDEMWDTLISCLRLNGISAEKPKDLD